MANNKIEFKNLWKKFDDLFALKNINYSINEREFFVIFGPSGAGKTTTLNIIAGLENPSAGEIVIDGKESNFMTPQQRDIRMAFENYSLYPHFTVYQNLASPLIANHVPKKEIVERVDKIAGTLGIQDLLKRLPKELSGGQKQRVSLGRALVIQSDVYLLDEPLAHLDAKIRNELRTEFHNIKSFLSHATVIYVTHDYLEALSLGERICVMDKGEIVQISTPKDLYYEPATTFVAKIVGQPEINLIDMTIVSEDDHVYLKNDGLVIALTGEHKGRIKDYNKEKVIFGCRPQFWDFSLTEPENNPHYAKALVEAYEIRNYKGVILAGISDLQVTILCESYEIINENEYIWIKPNENGFHLFDIDTGVNLIKN